MVPEGPPQVSQIETKGREGRVAEDGEHLGS